MPQQEAARTEAKIEWLRLQIDYDPNAKPLPDLYAALKELARKGWPT